MASRPQANTHKGETNTMSTSSIFANVKITKNAEAFVDAYVEAMEKPRKPRKDHHYLVSDPEKIREMIEKRKMRQGG